MAEEKYYAVHKSQKGTGLDKSSKLEVRVEWDVDGETLTYADAEITGRAGGVESTFEGVSYEEESGGAGEGYYRIYVEGDYTEVWGPGPNDYVHWIEVRVNDTGTSYANSNFNTVEVDSGTR